MSCRCLLQPTTQHELPAGHAVCLRNGFMWLQLYLVMQKPSTPHNGMWCLQATMYASLPMDKPAQARHTPWRVPT